MQVTLQIKLLPSPAQEQHLVASAKEYISLINDIVDYALGQGKMPMFTTSQVYATLPSALKNQAIQDAKSLYKKCRKTNIQHILRKPVIIWNNQNYTVSEGCVSMPLLVNGKSQRIKIKAVTRPDKFFKETSILHRFYTVGILRITAPSSRSHRSKSTAKSFNASQVRNTDIRTSDLQIRSNICG